jgi:hypothetical protein
MKDTRETAKELEERSLQRKGIVDTWGRSWKGELIIRLKEEHETQSQAVLRYTQALPATIEGENDERAVRCAKLAQDMLSRTRDLMLRLALHPTPPKAGHESRGGGRPRSRDPITEATLVSIDGSAPDANQGENPDLEA